MLESFNLGEFKYKKLTESEQRERKILGRLVGVIADTNNATRNGRKYGLDLWIRVFEDPVMKEKIANRCVFSELGHPTDREEIDMTKVCACLAEQPKLGADGKLYGVFDILDLPNGKILKTLCDYGTTIGVSSRGSGDIMDNNEVDPDTYNCECFDIVVVPAVKEARLKYINESLSTNNKTLKQALLESYNSADEADKKVMKETLDELEIDLDSTNDVNEEQKDAEIENTDFEVDLHANEVDQDEIEDYTIKELKKDLEKFDENSLIKFNPVEIDGQERFVYMTSIEENEDDNSVNINLGYSQETGDNIDNKAEDAKEEKSDAKVQDEASSDNELNNVDDVVDDDETSGVIESLKEEIRHRNELEKELNDLKKEKVVSDTEMQKLSEELNKYKTAFSRTSILASNAKKSEEKIKKLSEQLNLTQESLLSAKQQIATLKKDNLISLNESLGKEQAQIKLLNEQVALYKDEAEHAKEKLEEQATLNKKKLSTYASVAKKYQAQLQETLDEYIIFRASMLGVRPAEITSKLDENYNIKDINTVCDSILDNEMHSLSGLSFDLSKSSKVRFNESKQYLEDDGFDDLLELAGLK